MDWINEKSMDNIFVFFTTNRIKAIDPAVLSRFDKKINIWLPSFEKRIELFNLYITWKKSKSNNNIFKELDYKLLAKNTDWKSWRFIKQLVNNVVLNFAHTRIDNPRSKLITTKDIIEWINVIEKDEEKNRWIWFNAKF